MRDARERGRVGSVPTAASFAFGALDTFGRYRARRLLATSGQVDLARAPATYFAVWYYQFASGRFARVKARGWTRRATGQDH
ncbi:hypothetical protein CKO28_23075 [Rhodovibrio sodomensis]|uniref:Uncharacterized protein n=1 Tax=Rhodovibrio sodomensis TaxID=1088 RepID=A0ABS1DME4_9PROT|nr:hypothetical protein [Rhodovibrio sodomensis]MBK1670898.1 hypothetical protein [Rhodovibrio sodomensis]